MSISKSKRNPRSFKIRFVSSSAGKTRKFGEALGRELRLALPKPPAKRRKEFQKIHPPTRLAETAGEAQVGRTSHALTICLKGGLGSGKTTLIQGIARGLGLKRRIVSPTFLLMRIYPISQRAVKRKLFHIDAYRIANRKDAAILEDKKFFENPSHVIVVEWPERIPHLIHGPAIHINLSHSAHKNERSIIIQTKS